MLDRFASTAFVVGTLVTALLPAVGLARDHGSSNSGNRGRSFSGGSRYSGGQRFVSPRGYSRGYIAPRWYGRPTYRGYYNGGLYFGYGTPFGYPYDPGYAYGPAPAPQTCSEGFYDRYGAWVPNPNCYSNQQQYQLPPQNYDPNQLQRYNR